MPDIMECSLYFTPGSPFGRAIRIIMDEIGLEWDAQEASTTDNVAERLKRTPALQVPILFEKGLTLWDSSVITEYLLSAYGTRPVRDGLTPLAQNIARDDHKWTDKLLFATIQTLGESTVLVSQMRWSSIKPAQSTHVARNVDRVLSLLVWFEGQIEKSGDGFIPDCLSVQDIFCICHLMFITHRPLDIEWDRASTPKLAALYRRLEKRPSFLANPIEWWEPGED